MTATRRDGKMAHPRLVKQRHNRIKRRLELGMGKPGDQVKLKALRKELGYEH